MTTLTSPAAATPAAPRTQLTFLYNPPGIGPGKGARELTTWFTHDPKAGPIFAGAESALESLARDFVPYYGRNYLYATDVAGSPKTSAAVAALTDAYKAAMPALPSGKPYEFKPGPRHANGYPNGKWELITHDADSAGKETSRIFEGKFNQADQSPEIEKLEASLLEFGKFMRKNG